MTRILREITNGANALTILILGIMALIWLAAQDAVMIVAPVLVWASGTLLLLVALAVVYVFIEQRLTARAETRRDRTLANIDSQRETMRFQAEGALLTETIAQVKRGLIYPAQVGNEPRFTAFPSSVIKNDVPLLEAPAEALHFSTVAQKALSSRGAGRFIVFGSMDSGKTTIAKWTVQYAIQEIVKSQGGRVFIIDPHAPKVVWGDSLTVIGAGMDYRSIRAFLDHVKDDIKARYEAGCGNDNAPLPEPYRPNFIVCEEWTGVVAELKSNKQWTDEDNRMFYMDSRKAGWGYLLVTHGRTVRALGITGMGDLLEGVEYFITLNKNAITGEYSATLGDGFRDKAAFDLITPGPFNGRMYYNDVQVESERGKTNKYLALAPPPPAEEESILGLDVEPEQEPTDDEQTIIEAFLSVKEGGGFSWRKATKLAYGEGKFGEGPNEKMRVTLDKFGIDYSDYISG